MTWLKWFGALLAVGLAGLAGYIWGDHRRMRMAMAELRQLEIEQLEVQETSEKLKAEGAKSAEEAKEHERRAKESERQRRVLEEANRELVKEILKDLPDSERVRRFKRRIGYREGSSA